MMKTNTTTLKYQYQSCVPKTLQRWLHIALLYAADIYQDILIWLS